MPAIKTIPETKWFPVFREGTHTGDDGKARTYTEDDLDTIVQMNAPRTSEVPFTIGHPMNNSPKLGTLDGIQKRMVDGVAHLFVKGKDVVEEFSNQVAAHMYDQVSLSLWPSKKLKHIAFLGAELPGVEGLPQVQFSASAEATEEVLVQFAASSMERGILRQIVATLSSIRDYIIGREGVEVANTAVQPDMVKWLYGDIEALGSEASVGPTTSFSKGGADMTPELKALQDQVAQLTGQVASFSKENDSLKGQLTQATVTIGELKGTISATAQAGLVAQFSAYADGLITAGQLLPANKDLVVGLLTNVAAQQPVQFSKEVTQTPVDALKAVLQSYPKAINFSRVGTSDAAGKTPDNTDVNAIVERATQYAKQQAEKGIVVGMTAAVLAVTKDQ